MVSAVAISFSQNLLSLLLCVLCAFKVAALYLVKVGERKAKAGNIEKAVATFKKALKWNPQL